MLNIPKIIGHRGVKDLAPENTLDSIIEAFRIGLKWIEVDVKISKDNIPFLLHDDDFDRTTNGTGIASSYNYSQIKKLDAGKFFYKKDTKIEQMADEALEELGIALSEINELIREHNGDIEAN